MDIRPISTFDIDFNEDGMQNPTLIVATMILASTAALGASNLYTATLAQPLTHKKEFVVNGNSFRCDGSTCILNSPPLDAGSLRTCHQLQREVGTLTAFVAAGKPFDADKLAKCNAHS